MANIKLCADIQQCLLTVSADIVFNMMHTAHARLYNLWMGAGWGCFFDVAYEITIYALKVQQLQSLHTLGDHNVKGLQLQASKKCNIRQQCRNGSNVYTQGLQSIVGI